jgi:ankyrin repeat protein
MSDSEKNDELLNLSHDILLKIARFRIPSFTANGLCEGINCMLGQAVLIGEDAEKHFYDRLEFLSEYFSKPENTAETLYMEIDNVYKTNTISEETLKKLEKPNSEEYEAQIEKAKKSGSPLNPQELDHLKKSLEISLQKQKDEIRQTTESSLNLTKEQKKYRENLLDVDAFFNTIVRAHGTPLAGFTDVGEKYAGQFIKKWEHLTSIALDAPAGSNNDQYIHSVIAGIVVSNQLELKSYFRKIAEIISNQPSSEERPFFLLSADNHTISLYFNLSTKKWRFFDVNRLPNSDDQEKYFFEGDINNIEELAPNFFKAFFDDDKANTSFTIRHLSKQGYDLCLMTECEIKKDIDGKESRVPAAGMLYLDESGHYLFRDIHNKTKKGSLNLSPKDSTFYLSNLKEKCDDFEFKTSILEQISKKTAVPLIFNKIDSEINMLSNKFLYQGNNVPKTLTNSRGVNALYFAIMGGQTTLANTLIKSGFDINMTDNKGYSNLMWAAMYGRLDIVNSLIKNKALVNTTALDGYTALLIAVERDYPEVIKALIESADDENEKNSRIQTTVKAAVLYGQLDRVNAFIEASPDENTKTLLKEIAFFEAASFGQLKLLSYLLLTPPHPHINKTNSEGNTPLMQAVQNGHLATVAVLLEHGADITTLNHSGDDVLTYFAKTGTQEYQLLLMEDLPEGALTPKGKIYLEKIDQQIRYVMLDTKNQKVEGLLNIAIDLEELTPEFLSECKVDILNLISTIGHADVKIAILVALLKNNPNPDTNTEFMLAVKNGHATLVELLLASQPYNHALVDQNGDTALMLAVKNGHLSVAKLLIKAGANMAAINQEGDTALMTAIKQYKKFTSWQLLEGLQKAPLNIINKQGKTALMLTAELGINFLMKQVISWAYKRDKLELLNPTLLTLVEQHCDQETVSKLKTTIERIKTEQSTTIHPTVILSTTPSANTQRSSPEEPPLTLTSPQPPPKSPKK